MNGVNPVRPGEQKVDPIPCIDRCVSLGALELGWGLRPVDVGAQRLDTIATLDSLDHVLIYLNNSGRP